MYTSNKDSVILCHWYVDFSNFESHSSKKGMALTLLSYARETKFDLCDLSNLENQDHSPKIIKHREGPIGKLHTKYKIDSCKSCLIYHMEMDVFRWTASKHCMPNGRIKNHSDHITDHYH